MTRSAKRLAAMVAGTLLFTSGSQACLIGAFDHRAECAPSSAPSYYLLRNFDFKAAARYVSRLWLNPKKMKREAFRVYEDDIPVRWVSQANSVTTSIVGPTFAEDGINEHGLAGGVVLVSGTFWKEKLDQNKNAISDMQFLGMALDTCKTAKEVEQLFQRVSLRGLVRRSAPNVKGESDYLDYMFRDKDGAFCEITVKGGDYQATVHQSFEMEKLSEDDPGSVGIISNLPPNVLVAEATDLNSPDNPPVPGDAGEDAESRFYQAWYWRDHFDELPGDSLVEKMFALLDNSTWNRGSMVTKLGTTANVWQSVFHLDDGQPAVWFRLAPDNAIQELVLKKFFSENDDLVSVGIKLEDFANNSAARDFKPISWWGERETEYVFAANIQDPDLRARFKAYEKSLATPQNDSDPTSPQNDSNQSSWTSWFYDSVTGLIGSMRLSSSPASQTESSTAQDPTAEEATANI